MSSGVMCKCHTVELLAVQQPKGLGKEVVLELAGSGPNAFVPPAIREHSSVWVVWLAIKSSFIWVNL